MLIIPATITQQPLKKNSGKNMNSIRPKQAIKSIHPINLTMPSLLSYFGYYNMGDFRGWWVKTARTLSAAFVLEAILQVHLYKS